VIIVVAMLVVAIGFLFLADPLFDLDFGIIVEKRTSTSSLVALAGRDLMRLNTLEAVHKVVFPYDFVPAEVNWKRLFEEIELGRTLSPEEERYVSVYGLSERIGIDLDSKRREFIVVTAIAKIGLDLDRFASETRTVVNGTVGPVSVRSDGTVVVVLPPVTITDLIIDDSSSGDYGYPDVGISPEGWRLLAEFISDSVAVRIRESGLFVEAKDVAKRFLTEFFSQAGYDSVSFAE